jgi:hypothetical protein
MTGLTLASVCIIPGDVLEGNRKVAAYLDAKATAEQKEAIVAAHTSQLGGPLADLLQSLPPLRPPARAGGPHLIGLLLGGYLGVWVYFGLVPYLADGPLHAAMGQVPAVRAAAQGICGSYRPRTPGGLITRD